MLTLKQAATSVGYTADQVRKRLAMLAPLLDGAIHRGPRGAILLSEEAVDLLRRLRDLETSGHSLREAMSLALAQDGPGGPMLGPGSPTKAQGKPMSENGELIKILWTLVAILGFGVTAIVALGIASLMTR